MHPSIITIASSVIGLFLASLLTSCASSVQTAAMTFDTTGDCVFNIPLEPLRLLFGQGLLSTCRAKIQMLKVANNITEWEDLNSQPLGDIDKILAFVGDDSKFQQEWVSADDVNIGTRQTFLQFQQVYLGFLSKTQEAVRFKEIYETAMQSQSDKDIAALVRFVKANTFYELALDKPMIKDRHEQAMFNTVKSLNTTTSYEEFLAWYPNSAYTGEVKVLMDTIDFERSKRENTIAGYNSYLQAHPTGKYSSDVLSFREDLMYQQITTENCFTKCAEYLRVYPDGKYSKDITPLYAEVKGNNNKVIKLLDKIVAKDSRGWYFHEYMPGSLRNVEIVSKNGSDVELKGRFDYLNSYHGSGDSWVIVKFHGNKITCVTYWDYPNTCRPVHDD